MRTIISNNESADKQTPVKDNNKKETREKSGDGEDSEKDSDSEEVLARRKAIQKWIDKNHYT